MKSVIRLFVHAMVSSAVVLAGCASVPDDVTCINRRVGAGAGTGVTFDAIGDDLLYPRESCIAGREGTVVAKYTLLRNGEVEGVRIYKSSGDPLLDREVVRALESLKSRGKKVAWPSSVPDQPRALGEVSVRFSLK